ncbi:hypothetical protein [Roseibium sp. RKSG952]|uniref:hypothetical protein n=1 Tax=Roseibium sp. RKSG952 TaxID=2529384 RepID=UPI0012BD69A9|nr:hypothetical protein [Roseibium sp. RKSG952]MTH95980.1 hypothetical protein [Roseibium sp. RKSG952]
MFYLISRMRDLDIESIAIANESMYGPDGRSCALAADVVRRASENASVLENGNVISDGEQVMIARFTAESLSRLTLWDPYDASFEDETIFDVIGGWPEEIIIRVDAARLRPALAPTVMKTAQDHLVSTALEVLSQLPGAKRVGSTVIWAGSLPDREELISWLDVPGPGLIADHDIILTQGGIRVIS